MHCKWYIGFAAPSTSAASPAVYDNALDFSANWRQLSESDRTSSEKPVAYPYRKIQSNMEWLLLSFLSLPRFNVRNASILIDPEEKK